MGSVPELLDIWTLTFGGFFRHVPLGGEPKTSLRVYVSLWEIRGLDLLIKDPFTYMSQQNTCY